MPDEPLGITRDQLCCRKSVTAGNSPCTSAGKCRFPGVLRIVGHYGRMLQPPNNSPRPSCAVASCYPPSTYSVGSWRSYLVETLVKRTFLDSFAAVTFQATTSYNRPNCWPFWPPQNPTKDITQRTARRVTAQHGMMNKCTKPPPGCQVPELASRVTGCGSRFACRRYRLMSRRNCQGPFTARPAEGGNRPGIYAGLERCE